MADSSTIIALERAGLQKNLDLIQYKIIIPKSVLSEVGTKYRYFKNIKRH
mgnify:CR=1 FL=1